MYKKHEEKDAKYEEYVYKRAERNLRTLALNRYMNTMSRGRVQPISVTITFTYQVLEYTDLLHLNPLVIKLKIGNTMVSNVLVDEGSRSDIIFREAFQRMGIS